MKHLVAVFLLLSTHFLLQAQGVLISTNPGTPDPSAILDVSSSTHGFLVPRLSTVQRNAIISPAIGLQIYNTTTNCLQVYFPQSGWADLTCDCINLPNAGFTYSPNTINPNSPVVFTPVTGTGVTYSWQFQGGNPATSTAQNPSVTWANSGTFQVILTVTLLNGCSDSDTITVTVSGCSYVPGNQTFAYTGSATNFTVPACVTSLHIEAWGAQGGTTGGQGGYAEGDLVVSPGQLVYVYVGGQGANSSAGGFNGGGNSLGSTYGGSGGGASDVRSGGQALSDRVIVAGGGGGGTSGSTPLPGGAGGGLTGATGSNGGGFTAGTGGTQGAGGTMGCCYSGTQDGTLGVGGGNGSYHNAGGGGGYYGGGSGAGHAGAGGGSSYLGGVTNGVTQTGGRNGHGQVIISW